MTEERHSDLVLTSRTHQVLARLFLGAILSVQIYALYSGAPVRQVIGGGVIVLVAAALLLFSKQVYLEGSHLVVRNRFKASRIHLDRVLTVSWESPTATSETSDLKADVFLDQAEGFGNPISFVPRDEEVLMEFQDRLNLHHK